MKKRIVLLILAIASVAAFLTACGGNKETYNNIAAQSNPYSKGKQSIEIIASSGYNDEPNAKFKQTISPSDIELGGALEGKTVTEVVFNGETSITVTLDGDTKVAGGDGVYGTITVKQSGMESKGNSTCIVNLLVPVIAVGDYFGGGGGNNYLVSANLRLSAGEFTDNATAENITLSEDAVGKLSVTLADGMLTIEIKDCNTATPTIILKPQVTTFGKEYTVKIAPYSTTRL